MRSLRSIAIAAAAGALRSAEAAAILAAAGSFWHPARVTASAYSSAECMID